MPNNPRRDKQDGSRYSRRSPGKSRPADSVKTLLNRALPTLNRLTKQASRHASLQEWLEAHLPDTATARMSGVVERNDTLVIFTESAAWSARMRYAVAEIETELKRCHPQIKRVAVRVLPKT